MTEPHASPPLAPVLARVSAAPPVQRLAEALARGGPVPATAAAHGLPVLGVPRAGRIPLVAALNRLHPAPILYVVDKTDIALALARELALWLPPEQVLLYPEPGPLFYEPQPWSASLRAERIAALAHLAAFARPGAKPTPRVLVAPARALMTRTLPRRVFLAATVSVRVGQVRSPLALARALVRAGYEPASIVTGVGQFARRGDILDVWPPTQPHPVRLDFFGDEIERVRAFDPATQRTIAALERVDLPPAREILRHDDDAEPPSEALIPQRYPPASVLDYLPSRALLITDDIHTLRQTVDALEDQAVRLREEAVAHGHWPADGPLPYQPWDALAEGFPQGRAFSLGPYTGAGEPPPGEAEPREVADLFVPLERFGGQLVRFLDHLAQHLAQGAEVWVVTRQKARLTQMWRDFRRRRAGRVFFVEASAREGVGLRAAPRAEAEPVPQPQVLVYTDTEIFGWRPPQVRRRPRPAPRAPEQAYADLRPGDYVVHLDHGIGRFRGLVQRVTEGVAQDYLLIEYAEGDQLYVPVHQADRVTRYVGPDATPPRITRLGTGQWQQVKAKARRAALAVAQDLLELYARRQAVKGHAFSPDTEWQLALEAAFPYEETPDQQRALAEVKRDMESPRPMDRLLCGDVGFGKTEIALRAAFKAVMDGKQVAMLVPTTVLAQQHYRTFRERLAPFPVVVEMLSRFRTPKEQARILRGLRHGTIDIVIGTHRLLSPDVQFKDLGLVIIDEEQRFGVTHKEHFKRLRTEVDVLTLTATPIPRTLYLALSGARDISIIQTPPAERLPVVTHIGPYEPGLVRRAIWRELDRGGQVFYVHNRVDELPSVAARLARLVPQARIAVAHGQMPERELAQVMERFAAGEIDVLVTTTIIEAGLDFPRANTLIVERADRFGLAQLYQLRGRIGRGALRAYAYFFWSPTYTPRPEAKARLEVLAEHAYLGAGMQIALRDLELRGAGELLGTRQHGHVAAVGFHLYTRLLAEAVAQLRAAAGWPAPTRDARGLTAEPVSVELPLPVGIPPEYVPDPEIRLALYRRLAEVESLAQVEAFGEELRDRFGPWPEPVAHLLYLMRVKLLAQAAGLASVGSEQGHIVLRYRPRGEGAPPRTLRELPAPWRTGRETYWLPRDAEGRWRAQLLAGLRLLAQKPPTTEGPGPTRPASD